MKFFVYILYSRKSEKGNHFSKKKKNILVLLLVNLLCVMLPNCYIIRWVQNVLHNTCTVHCTVYSTVCKIYQGAATVHVLHAYEGIKPILVRFLVRDMRGLVFKHMKEYAPRDRASTPDRTGRYFTFPIFEDLTVMTFTKMRAIAAHPDVTACWSNRGQLRFKLTNSENVRKVF